MRRELAGIAAALMVLVGCGGDDQTTATAPPTEEVDRLLADIATGGTGREDASARIDELADDLDLRLRRASAAQLTTTLDSLEKEAKPLRGTRPPICGSWADTEAYKPLRDVTRQVFEVAALSSASDVAKRWQNHPDPFLAAWAVNAVGLEPDPAAVKLIAENNYARYILNNSRDEIAKLVPEPLASTEASARAQMAYYLAESDDLGCEPIDIELEKKVRTKDDVDYYVFRFRPKPRDPWVAGFTGPWVPNTFKHAPRNGSDFTPIEDATPEEHLARMRGTT